MYLIMTPYLIIAGLLALPLLLGLLFRVGAPHIFFSVMAGELLGRYFSHDGEELLLEAANDPQLAEYIEVAIIILPLLLTSFFLRGSLSKSKLVLHVFPFVITGLVLAAFVLPVLPESLIAEIKQLPVGMYLLELSNVIIGTVIVFQLIALWLLNRGNDKKRGKKD